MGSKVKMLFKTASLRTSGRRRAIPDEDNDLIQDEYDSQNNTIPPNVDQEQEEQETSEPPPPYEDEDERDSNPVIHDPAPSAPSAPATSASILSPWTQTSSLAVIPFMPSSNQPPLTVTPPTPHPTAGVIRQDLNNSRGSKSMESMVEEIENTKKAWEGKYYKEGEEDHKEEENYPDETMESRMLREQIENDQLNRQIRNQNSEDVNPRGRDLQNEMDDVFSQQSGVVERLANKDRLRYDR